MATTTTNLLDPNAKQITQATTDTATAATYDPAAVTSTATYNAPTYNATNYDATQGTATNWNVSEPQTVQGQIKGIIEQNSPLMQMAHTKALQGMNARGLTNSSMATGAADTALYAAALPIAQQDATTNANSAQFNANAANTMTTANMTADNAEKQFNANADTQAAATNAGLIDKALASNASATNATNQFNANAQTQANAQNATAQNQTAQFNAQQSNAMGQYNASQQNEILKTQISAQLDNDAKLALADIEATYKVTMQANDATSNMYMQALKSISDIQTNGTLAADAKKTAIQNQLAYLKTGMQMLEKMDGIPGLGNLLNVSATV